MVPFPIVQSNFVKFKEFVNIFGTPYYAPVIVREAFSAAWNVWPAGGD